MAVALRPERGGSVMGGVHSGVVLGADEQHAIAAGVRIRPSLTMTATTDLALPVPPEPGLRPRLPAVAVDRYPRLAPVTLVLQTCCTYSRRNP